MNHMLTSLEKVLLPIALKLGNQPNADQLRTK